MNTKTRISIAAVAVMMTACAIAPADAQNYHQSYGTSRVVNQHQTGLYEPSGTYIGGGTLSQSAQGKSAGIGGALPAVNMGSHVRTAGDNMYNNDGTDRMSNGALIYEDQKQAILARKAAIYRKRRMDAMRAQRQQMQVQQGTVYMPGSNGASASYASAPMPQIQYSRSGNATYGDSYTGQSATRKF